MNALTIRQTSFATHNDTVTIIAFRYYLQQHEQQDTVPSRRLWNLEKIQQQDIIEFKDDHDISTVKICSCEMH